MGVKSRLKNIIQEIYKIENRERIEFKFTNDGYISICIADITLFQVDLEENTFCCGILELGDTVYSTTVNNINITELPEDIQNQFYTLCMEQVYKLLVRSVEDGNIKKGLASWTHTYDNPIVKALESEFGKENSSWKLTNIFFNPNSGNTVHQYTVNINPIKK